MSPNLLSIQTMDGDLEPVYHGDLPGLAGEEEAFRKVRGSEHDLLESTLSRVPSGCDANQFAKDQKQPLNDILLIEDDVPLRGALTRALSCSGYTVLTANDGKAGLALLARHRFRLVITDIFMPENDGLEVIMKQRSAQPNSRILAMSGFCGYVDVPTMLRMAEVLGSQRTLLKPFSLIDFLDAVNALLNDSNDYSA
jgi:CheY-like chemotaxis protein